MISILATIFLQGQDVNYGNSQLYYERYASAERIFHEALKNHPDDGKAWYGLAKAYLYQNKSKAALDSFQFASASVRQDPYYKVSLGALLLHNNKIEEAAALFNDALKETKEKNAELLSCVAEAHVHSDNGDANYAIDLLHRAVKRDKHNPSLKVQLGDAWRKLVNGSEAYKAYMQAINDDDKYAAAYCRIGEIFLSQKSPSLYLDYFRKAVAADASYSPAHYRLYIYEFNRHPANAIEHYKAYMRNADASIQTEYDLADLYYLTGQYDSAIQKATRVVAIQKANTAPRLYKLIGYSYAGLNDTINAVSFMQRYFSQVADSDIISKDYEFIGELYSSLDGKEDSAIGAYQQAVLLEKDTASLYSYYKRLADLSKDVRDYAGQAKWMGLYSTGNEKSTNVDLFNWGIALYRAGNYSMSDSVFKIYSTKYPDQAFGYYWQARSRSLLDSGMKEGLAIPAYEKLIEVMEKDTTNPNYKKWMSEAYGYLAAYEINIRKDIAEGIDHFKSILMVDPENENAKKYISMLENEVANKSGK